MLMLLSKSLNSSKKKKKNEEFIIEVMGLLANFITVEQLAILF